MNDFDVVIPYDELSRLIWNEQTLTLISTAYMEGGCNKATRLMEELWDVSPHDRPLRDAARKKLFDETFGKDGVANA